MGRPWDETDAIFWLSNAAPMTTEETIAELPVWADSGRLVWTGGTQGLNKAGFVRGPLPYPETLKDVPEWLRARRIRVVIPERKLPAGKTRRRRGRPCWRRHSSLVGTRSSGRLEEHRSLATRFDKLASSFLTMIKLACIRLLLRAAFPNTA